MTREEAIEHLNTIGIYYSQDHSAPYGECARLTKDELDAICLAIEALEQEPCGDAISRQAAFNAFGLSEKSRKYGGDHSGYDTLMKYEIQDVLENLPPVTLNPCGDAIDRFEAIKIASGYCHPANVAKELAKLPPVTVEPKVGHWIANAPQYDMLNPQYICSECGNAHTRTTPYCEMCGVKMQEVEE